MVKIEVGVDVTPVVSETTRKRYSPPRAVAGKVTTIGLVAPDANAVGLVNVPPVPDNCTV
jgi:hypothetical protein